MFTSLQVDEMDGLKKDRDAKRASISALQEEVQLHREQVQDFSMAKHNVGRL